MFNREKAKCIESDSLIPKALVQTREQRKERSKKSPDNTLIGKNNFSKLYTSRPFLGRMLLKKILYMAESANRYGTAKVLYLILKYLDRQRYYPLLILGDDGPMVKDYESLGVSCKIIKMPKVLHLNFKFFGINIFNPWAFFRNFIMGFIYSIQLAFYLKSIDFDILHLNSLLARIFGTCAWVFSGKKGRLIWHVHEIQPTGIREWITQWMACHFPSIVLTVSAAVSLTYKKAVKTEKLRLIYNGLEPPPEDKESIRKEFGIENNKSIISVVGRICSQKGQMVVIKAVPDVIKDFKNVLFLIVGEPWGIDGDDYLLKLHEIIDSTKTKDYILFTGIRPDGVRFIRQSDIFVSCAVYNDPLPTTILEAMQSEVPVIATNTGGQPEMISDGVNGYLVEPNDSVLLAEKIKILMSNFEKRKTMGEEGRKIFEKKFTVKRFIKDIESVYDELIKTS